MKLILNYPEYSITTDGRVFSHKKPGGNGKGKVLDYSYKRELKPQKDKKGYLKIILEQNTNRMKSTSVHRLVAETYIPNPNNYDTVNHINQDKIDNRVENLEWMSNANNVEYSQAKTRLIETPIGEIIEVFNLTKWCREVLNHPSSGTMLRTLRNPGTTCKGYKLLK
jgi:hypothetical protein